MTDDEKITRIEEYLDELALADKTDKQLINLSYGGSGICAGTAGLCEIFSLHADPVEFLGYATGLLALSLAVTAMNKKRYPGPQIKNAEEVLDKLRKRNAPQDISLK